MVISMFYNQDPTLPSCGQRDELQYPIDQAASNSTHTSSK